MSDSWGYMLFSLLSQHLGIRTFPQRIFSASSRRCQHLDTHGRLPETFWHCLRVVCPVQLCAQRRTSCSAVRASTSWQRQNHFRSLFSVFLFFFCYESSLRGRISAVVWTRVFYRYGKLYFAPLRVRGYYKWSPVLSTVQCSRRWCRFHTYLGWIALFRLGWRTDSCEESLISAC